MLTCHLEQGEKGAVVVWNFKEQEDNSHGDKNANV